MFKTKKTPIVYQAIATAPTKGLIPGAFIMDPHDHVMVVVKSVIKQTSDDFHVTVEPIDAEHGIPFLSSTFSADPEQPWTVYKHKN